MANNMATRTAKAGGGASPGRGGRRTKLLVAALLAVVSATLAFVYLQENATSSVSTPVQPMTVSVLTAAQEIPAQATIRAEMLALRDIPREAVVDGAYRTADDVVGTVARYPLAAGEQVTPVKVSPGRQAVGLAAAVPEGLRAMAISASVVVTAGGLLQPGDRVDILAVVAADSEATDVTGRVGDAVSVVLVEDAEVLAVAQRLIDLVPPPASGGGPGGDRELTESESADDPAATTVTLALTAQQAQQVLLHEQQGVIRLIVRPTAHQTRGGQ